MGKRLDGTHMSLLSGHMSFGVGLEWARWLVRLFKFEKTLEIIINM